MVNIWNFIPHRREIEDSTDYSKPCNDPASKLDKEILKGNPNYHQLADGSYVEIKEYRDESKRSWWKFFDEYEYRETVEESKNHKSFYWFEPGMSTAEKKLVTKLDILIAFYAFVGYWIKYIDSQNLNNAYVSHMKEDLNMQGNDLINTQVLFSAAAAVFTLPSMYLMPRIPLTYLMFGLELGWSLFTLGLYKVTTVTQLQALRWFVACFEGLFFPTVNYLLASWYKPSEISRRGGFFYMGQFLGILTAGLIASATFDNLDGVGGMAGWRYMYIFDFCASIGVALLALVMVPGTPLNCYSLWLTDEEIILSRKRMHENGTQMSRTNKPFFDKGIWKKVASDWKVYYLSILSVCIFNTNNSSSGSFTIWLKSLSKYSIGEINKLSAVPPALGIFYIFIICFGADFTRKRFGFCILSFIMTFIGNVILAIWDVPYGAKWFAFCSSFWSWSQASVFYCATNDMYRRDSDIKPIAWTIVYLFGTQSAVWINRLVWPTVDSPRYPKGFGACAGFAMGFNILVIGAYILYKRDERKEAILNGIYVYNSDIEVPEVAHEFSESSVSESSEKIEANKLASASD